MQIHMAITVTIVTVNNRPLWQRVNHKIVYKINHLTKLCKLHSQKLTKMLFFFACSIAHDGDCMIPGMDQKVVCHKPVESCFAALCDFIGSRNATA